METGKKLIAARGKGVKGDWWKEGEQISQRTCMNDPWTWTTERRLTMGERGGLDGRGQKGKNLEL